MFFDGIPLAVSGGGKPIFVSACVLPFMRRDGDRIRMLSKDAVDKPSGAVVDSEDEDDDESLRLSSFRDVARELVVVERWARYFAG